MRRLRREVEEEGRATGSVVDELDRLVAQHVGRVVGIRAAERVLDAVLDQRVVEVIDLLEDVPFVPSRRLVGRRRAVPVDVLAVDAGVVARGLEPHGERRGVVEGGESAVRAPVVVHAGGVRVLRREQARAAWRAQVGGDVAVLEGDALLHQLAHDRRHDGRDAVDRVGEPDRVEALIVGQDEDDVRPERRRVRPDPVDPGLEQRHQGAVETRGVDGRPGRPHRRVALLADVGHVVVQLRGSRSSARRAFASASADDRPRTR